MSRQLISTDFTGIPPCNSSAVRNLRKDTKTFPVAVATATSILPRICTLWAPGPCFAPYQGQTSEQSEILPTPPPFPSHCHCSLLITTTLTAYGPPWTLCSLWRYWMKPITEMSPFISAAGPLSKFYPTAEPQRWPQPLIHSELQTRKVWDSQLQAYALVQEAEALVQHC